MSKLVQETISPVALLDWRTRTRDPNDQKVRQDFYDYLLSRRETIDATKQTFLEFIASKCSAKSVLDIGICDHALEFINDPNWKHGRLKQVASHILGIDILSDLIEILQKRGYNVRCVDGTGDEFLGEKFETVVCADVIEHVNDPVRLLNFAKRHLVHNGSILIATPNPFCFHFIKRIFQKGTFVANLEHTLWITPSIAVELGYRAGLMLNKYYVFDGSFVLWKKAIRKILPVEFKSLHYVFEYKAIENV